MIRLIYFWIKYLKLVAKIRERLPHYVPGSGQRLNWDIQPGYYKEVLWDLMTGKMIRKRFVPKPRIRQKSPGNIFIDEHVYEFDWNKKELKMIMSLWR